MAEVTLTPFRGRGAITFLYIICIRNAIFDFAKFTNHFSLFKELIWTSKNKAELYLNMKKDTVSLHHLVERIEAAFVLYISYI
ncbi:hypothetical protein DD595_25450 [Enterobacter cloacae complex sp. 4DZ3-17B2]|nr:hypothetical protein DD595_25450 [Enterobacter cloacae complex sp. 4DZ3-17B2]